MLCLAKLLPKGRPNPHRPPLSRYPRRPCLRPQLRPRRLPLLPPSRPAPAPVPPPAPPVAPAPVEAAPPPPPPAPARCRSSRLPLRPPSSKPAPTEAPPADPEPDLPPAEPYSEAGDSWYDAIEFSAFVDAYASVNYNFPKPQYGKNVLRAHDANNGFSLSWIGVNASYPADPVGATISLRFGPTAHQIAAGCFADDKAACDSGQGLENVKQAFASWKPGGSDSLFTLDVGKFETPFGAEVSESHLNMNYTRSMLYASQPVTHTGLRGTFSISDAFDFKILAVNGWNNSVDNNVGKTFGGQLNFHFKNAEDNDLVGISVGYLGGPEHDDTLVVKCGAGELFSPNSTTCISAPTNTEPTQGVLDRASANTDGWRHLVDLVVTANPIEQLRLVLNADFGRDSVRSQGDPNKYEGKNYFGVLLGARVAVVEQFGVALRGEYFRDTYAFINPYPQNEQNLVGGTLTLDYLPNDFLTIRLDNRFDWSDRLIFNKEIRDLVGTQFTTTLGVVAHTN